MSVKGYIFGMLYNFFEKKHYQDFSNMDLQCWQEQLVAIGKETAIGGLAVATALLQRLQEYELKMKTDTLVWMNELVKGLILRIIQEDKSAKDNEDTSTLIQDRLVPEDIQEILLKLLY
jgi:hypothetical protein